MKKKKKRVLPAGLELYQVSKESDEFQSWCKGGCSASRRRGRSVGMEGMAPLQQAAALAYPSHVGFAKSGEAPFHPKFFGKFLVCTF